MLEPKPSVSEGCCRPQHPNVSTGLTLTFLLYSSILLSLFFLGLATNELMTAPTQAQVLDVDQSTVVSERYNSPLATISPTTTSITPNPTVAPTPLPSPSSDPLAQKEAIRKYIYTIFGKHGPTAFAISLAEGKAKMLYKGQVVYDADAIRETNAELSVGIFQINLKSKETLVHYHRIPGETLDQKITWLQDPYNNTLYAYWVYSHSGFWPWSVYSDGSYTKYLIQ